MPTQENIYDLGELIVLTGAWVNPESTPTAGAALDPTTVKCVVRKPSGARTVYTYPTSPELTKDSTGNYRCEITADEYGRWYYGWYSTGTGKAAEESSFWVKKNKALTG